MRWSIGCGCLVFIAAAAAAADKPRLTDGEISDGWVMLFDGATTFGWSVEGRAVVDEGVLILGGGDRPTVLTSKGVFGRAELRWTFRQDGTQGALMTWRDEHRRLSAARNGFVTETYEPGSGGNSSVVLTVPATTTLRIRDFAIRPKKLTPLFNGKDLAGWKPFSADPKLAKSKFTVTREGWLNVKNGPGDLQTEEQFDDFILQLECISNGRHLNSGIFFRCLPGEYQQGYEAQIHNGFKDNDRTKPVDFGTGAIYRRRPARQVVSDDGKWFTMTLLARGKQLLTWVNGYPTADFLDERPEDPNPRKGSRTGKGPISIPGHDPTTDLSFRNIRIVKLTKP
jgi:3-keto-disaccharide hydrolase